MNTMIQTHLIEEGNLHYLEFINDLIKIMVNYFFLRVAFSQNGFGILTEEFHAGAG